MRFVRPREVREMIGVSRTTLWRMVQAGAFPKPVRITERSCGYLLEAVEEWMRARAAGVPWAAAASMGTPAATAVPPGSLALGAQASGRPRTLR